MNIANAFGFPDMSQDWRITVTSFPVTEEEAEDEHNLLNTAFCSEEEPEDDVRAELIIHLRTEVDRLTACEKQYKIENAALLSTLKREKAEQETFRDRAMDMIVSRTAEIERLKKEVATLTADRDLWQARHSAVRRGAARLVRERDEARANALRADLAVARATQSFSRLRADAPTFIPSGSVNI